LNIDDIDTSVGQLMLVGFEGTDSKVMVDAIKKYHFGNIIFFKRNVESIAKLKLICKEVYEAALEYNGLPPFIAIDQEGGSVRRILKGITNVPGAMAICAASSHIKDAASKIGTIISTELRDIGINLNIAPVVDVNTNCYNPVIGIRGFSDDPHRVAQLAQQFFIAHQNNGVMACYKHFCGHGSVLLDSHLSLPTVDKTLQQLQEIDMVPYMNSPLPDSIMTAHILFSKIDPNNCATISRSIVQGILRDQLKYDGLVLTDCFEMDGLNKFIDIQVACVKSVNAGCDLITVSHTLQRQINVKNALTKAVKDGDIKESVLMQALDRIVKYKAKYCVPIKHKIDKARNQQIATEIAKASIVVNGDIGDIGNAVIVGVKNQSNTMAEDELEVIDVATSVVAQLGILGISVNLGTLDGQILTPKNGAVQKKGIWQGKHDKTVNETQFLKTIDKFAKGKRVILAISNSQINPRQAWLYNKFIDGVNDNILVSLRTPYDILGRPKPKCHICTFEYTELSIKCLIDILKGEKPKGVMPVKI